MSYRVLEIEFFTNVNDSMIEKLHEAGLSNSLTVPDAAPVTLPQNRFGRVFEKSDRALRQDIIDEAVALMDAFDREQALSALLWDRPCQPTEGLSEKESTPRKIYEKGVIGHELNWRELNTHLRFQFISNNRVMIFGEDALFVYDIEKKALSKKLKCSLPYKFIEHKGNGYLLKSSHKLILSYDPQTFKRNPSSAKLKSHIEDLHLYDEENFILASGKSVYLLNIQSQELKLIYTNPYLGANDRINEIYVSEDREFLLSYCPSAACEYDTVIWNLKTQKEQYARHWHIGFCSRAIYIAKNSIVTNAFARCTTDPQIRNQFYTLELNDGKMRSWTPGGYEIIGLSNTGKYTVVNNKHEVELRDPDTDEVLYKSNSFVEEIIKVRFSEDDNRIGVVTSGHLFCLNLPINQNDSKEVL